MMYKKSIDKNDRAYLARNMAGGAAVGAVGASSLGLLYMLYRSLYDKELAKKREANIPFLSANPLEAGDPLKGASDNEEPSWLSDQWQKLREIPENLSQGAVMYPLAAAAAAIPAYYVYKKLHDVQDSSEADRLKRELEQAREDFSTALAEGTKLSQDIDEFLEVKEASETNPAPSPDLTLTSPAEGMYDRFGGASGLAGGIMSSTAIASALLAFMAINRYLSRTNKNTNSVEALNKLQRRRKALNEIAPSLNIMQAPDGGDSNQQRFYVDY